MFPHSDLGRRPVQRPTYHSAGMRNSGKWRIDDLITRWVVGWEEHQAQTRSLATSWFQSEKIGIHTYVTRQDAIGDEGNGRERRKRKKKGRKKKWSVRVENRGRQLHRRHPQLFPSERTCYAVPHLASPMRGILALPEPNMNKMRLHRERVAGLQG